MITNSFENLRSKSIERQDRKSSEGSAADHAQSLFTRKSSIDTLMSPVHSNSSSTEEESEVRLQEKRREGRMRSWTSGDTPIPPLPPSRLLLDMEDCEGGVSQAGPEGVLGSEEGGMSGDSTPISESPHCSGNFPRLHDPLHDRLSSLTPPTSGTGKHHSRVGSHEVRGSVRQEIFESVVTPGKLERAHRKTTASSDICMCVFVC